MTLELQKSILRQVVLGYIFTYKATGQQCYRDNAIRAYKQLRGLNMPYLSIVA